MTKAKKDPDTCDICGLKIDSEKQYLFEVYDGNPWSKKQVKGANMDCCHKCFLDICKQGYEPKWATTIKNPLYVKGGSQPYRIPMPETDVHIGQDEQKVLA